MCKALGLITGVTSDTDPPDLTTVKGRLKYARGTRGWSQTQLAEKAGVAQSTVGNIEYGRSISRGSLPLLADALGFNLLWLRDGKGAQQGEETVELQDTDYAMLLAFQDMGEEDRQRMLIEAMERAQSFKKLSEEAIKRFGGGKTAGADAFVPPKPGKSAKAPKATVRAVKRSQK